MNFLLSMLPIYLFGNFHCLGMCGPLVMLIGKNRYRNFYFLGRTFSFTLAGLIAGTLGEVLTIYFKNYYISAFMSLFFGLVILLIAMENLLGIQINMSKLLIPKFAPINRYFTKLLLQDSPLTTFLFGFSTILLPCGQTILVYSACAIYCTPLTGLMNGFLFALLTSPSLYFSMHAWNYLNFAKKYYHKIIGMISLFIAFLSICRGLAEIEIIPHLLLNLSASEYLHFVIY